MHDCKLNKKGNDIFKLDINEIWDEANFHITDEGYYSEIYKSAVNQLIKWFRKQYLLTDDKEKMNELIQQLSDKKINIRVPILYLIVEKNKAYIQNDERMWALMSYINNPLVFGAAISPKKFSKVFNGEQYIGIVNACNEFLKSSEINWKIDDTWTYQKSAFLVITSNNENDMKEISSFLERALIACHPRKGDHDYINYLRKMQFFLDALTKYKIGGGQKYINRIQEILSYVIRNKKIEIKGLKDFMESSISRTLKISDEQNMSFFEHPMIFPNPKKVNGSWWITSLFEAKDELDSSNIKEVWFLPKEQAIILFEHFEEAMDPFYKEIISGAHFDSIDEGLKFIYTRLDAVLENVLKVSDTRKKEYNVIFKMICDIFNELTADFGNVNSRYNLLEKSLSIIEMIVFDLYNASFPNRLTLADKDNTRDIMTKFLKKDENKTLNSNTVKALWWFMYSDEDGYGLDTRNKFVHKNEGFINYTYYCFSAFTLALALIDEIFTNGINQEREN